jgi:hypothetical protein
MWDLIFSEPRSGTVLIAIRVSLWCRETILVLMNKSFRFREWQNPNIWRFWDGLVLNQNYEQSPTASPPAFADQREPYTRQAPPPDMNLDYLIISSRNDTERILLAILQIPKPVHAASVILWDDEFCPYDWLMGLLQDASPQGLHYTSVTERGF